MFSALLLYHIEKCLLSRFAALRSPVAKPHAACSLVVFGHELQH